MKHAGKLTFRDIELAFRDSRELLKPVYLRVTTLVAAHALRIFADVAVRCSVVRPLLVIALLSHHAGALPPAGLTN